MLRGGVAKIVPIGRRVGDVDTTPAGDPNCRKSDEATAIARQPALVRSARNPRVSIKPASSGNRHPPLLLFGPERWCEVEVDGSDPSPIRGTASLSSSKERTGLVLIGLDLRACYG
jgi:hypothetical protein